MKKMNFLFTMVFALVIGACTNENQPEELSSVDYKANQEKTVYLEIEFHQAFLAHKKQQISEAMIHLEEEIENTGEGHEALEELQQEMESVNHLFEVNQDLIERFGRGPIGGVRPGRPCSDIDGDGSFICPMPQRALESLLFNKEQLGEVTLQTANGEICGEMVDVENVSGADGQFVRAIFEGDIDETNEITITKKMNGEEITYSIPVM